MSNLYKNRIGNNLNRRKLTIVSQTPNEMIVDVERADSIEQGNEGTPITASTLNSFEDRIATAESNSSVALSNASTALSNSTSAVSDASTALSNSTQALSAANSAYSTVQTLESQIGERGAIVKVNNVAQTEINFSSEPQTQIDSKLTKSFSNLSSKNSIDNSDILVLQDNLTNNNVKIVFNTIKQALLDTVYPIGSVYLSINSTNPQSLFGGTWVNVSQGRALFGAGTLNGIQYTANSEINAGLPNIVGSFGRNGNNPIGGNTDNSNINYEGVFTTGRHGNAGGFGNGNGWAQKYWIDFDASRCSSIYGNSQTVQPNAYVVYVWKRTA